MTLYPFDMIDESVVSALRNDVETAESKGMLSDSQLEIIHQQNWFKLFVPKDIGGLALSLPEAVRLEEELARVDGSVAWTVTLCGGASLFAGFLRSNIRTEIFSRERICVAGSGLENGTARVVSNGYYITGNWPYATGAAYADYFTANCVVEGTGEVKSFVFARNEVQVQDTWNVFGLKATASHAFSVKNLRLPFDRSFVIGESGTTLPDAVYRYPFVQLAEATLAVNIFGMASRFLEISQGVIFGKKNSTGILLFDNSEAALRRMRGLFYEALDRSWINHLDNRLTASDLQLLSSSSKEMARLARNFVNELFPYCGLSAAHVGHPVSRVWRDINTAGQHGVLLGSGE